MTDEIISTCIAPDCGEDITQEEVQAGLIAQNSEGNFCQEHSWEYRKHGRILDNWEFMRLYAG